MQREEPSLLEKALLMAAAAVVVYGFVAAMFSLEPKNAPQAPAISSSNGSSPSSLRSQPAALSDYDRALRNLEREFPLPYTATITQYGDGIAEPRTRFYVPKDKK